jgi:hypothetical protein
MTSNQTREGSVIAVQVRRVDPPQYVADDIEDLLDRSSRFWSGEQCDSCGCCAYVIERAVDYSSGSVYGWQVRCCGEPDTAREYEAMGADQAQVDAVRTGCGATYRLGWYHESQVQF